MFFQIILRLTRQHWVLITSLLLLCLTIVSLRPLNLVLPPDSDKTLHLLVYAALAIPVCLRKPKHLLFVLIGLALWSGAIELIQPYVGRHAEWLDFIANISGLLIGWIFANSLNRIFKQMSKE